MAHARAQLGFPYIYAFWGNKLTVEYIEWSQRKYMSVWNTDGRLAERDKRARGQVGKFPRAYDCAGLIKSYWMQPDANTAAKYIESKDKSAHGLYQCCKTNGKIAALPKGEAGILVFIWDGKNGHMRHVGVYDGKGRVIEAQGFSTGVIERPLSAGSWTHWGRLDWLERQASPSSEKPATAPPEAQNGALKKGDRVRVTKSGVPYYPGAYYMIPGWLPGRKEPLPVTQVGAMGGAPCVLLGDGNNTWCDIANLEKA